MPAFSRSNAARIVSAATAPLSSLSPAVWQGAQIAVTGRRRASRPTACSTAWLLWHSTQPLSKICAWTLVCELRREDRVAGAAHVGDRADARRRGAVVAVAVVAGRRREIVALGERGVVDALLVVGELIGRQRRAVGAACTRPCASDRRGSSRRSSATLVGKTGDLASLTSRMPCGAVAAGARGDVACRPSASRLPCTLVAYSAA